MTDAKSRPTSSPDAERGASVRGRRPPRRKRFRIQVEPSDLSLHKLPLKQRVLNGIKTSWPGYVSSFAFHFIVLLLFWVILAPRAYRLFGGQGGEAMIDLLLTNLEEKSGQKADPKQPRKPAFAFHVKADPEPIPKPKKFRKKPGKSAGKGSLPLPVRPVDVQSLFKNRKPENRERVLKEVDPEKKIRRAIAAGLNWLQWQQKSDGHWRLYGQQAGYPDPGEYASISTKTGATAMAMLAFLGDGHTHKKSGRYQKTVARGIQWLIGIQKSNGDLHDVDQEGRDAAFYAHSQAVIVLCEAFAMTGDKSLREPAERGVKYLLESQNTVKGGWKYRPQLPSSKGDLSVTGWALMALHSARSAGLEVPPRAYELASRFLDSVQMQNGSRYKYEALPSMWPVTPTMTAEGLLCRQFLGWPKDHPALRKGVAYLKRPRNEPRWKAGGRGRPHVYYWYYSGQVFHNLGGSDWKTWYDKTAMMIVDRQSRIPGRKKNLAGSWNPKGRDGSYGFGEVGGRLYMTAMCLLVLEMPIRHRSVY